MNKRVKLLSMLLTIAMLFSVVTNFCVMAETASDNTFIVSNMKFYNGDTQIETVEGATDVSVDVTRKKRGDEDGTLIISTYSDIGEFLGRYCVSNYIEYGKTASTRIYMNVPEGKEVAEVKAFVWKSLSDMTPLSNSLSSNDEDIGSQVESVKFSVHDLYLDNYKNYGTIDQSYWQAIRDTATPYLELLDRTEGETVKYMLNHNGSTADVDVYVNGVIAQIDDPIWNYVINAEVGEIELINFNKIDGMYDAIKVNTYVTGLVDAVTSSGKVIFKEATDSVSTFVLDEDNVAVDFNVYYNGEEISVSDIQENDVLSVAYNVNSAGTTVKDIFANSDFYQVYVSRNVVTDTLRAKDDENNSAKFGDTYYEFITTSKYNSFDSASKLGDEYKIYLDAFDRVFKAEKSFSNTNWGIAENFTLNTGAGDDDYKITLFTGEGTTVSYYVDSTKTALYNTFLKGITDSYGTVQDNYGNALTGNAKLAYIWDMIYTSYYSSWSTNPAGAQPTMTGRQALTGRVVQYKVSAETGYLTELTFATPSVTTNSWVDIDNNGIVDAGEGSTCEEFNVNTNSIGSIKLGEATKIIDATKYDPANRELSILSLSNLVDGVEYEAYAYEAKIDGVHPFVLIVDGEAKYNKRTRFAVVTKTGYQEIMDENNNTLWSIYAMYGDATELLVADNLEGGEIALNSLTAGDVIVFETDNKGYIQSFDKLFGFTAGAIPSTDEALAAYSLVANANIYSNLASNIFVKTNFTTPVDAYTIDWTTLWTGANAGCDSADAVRLVFGPIIEKTDTDVTFAKLDEHLQTNTAAVGTTETYNFADDIRVYAHDYAKVSGYRFKYYGNDVSEIIPTIITDSMMAYFGSDIVDWGNTYNQTNVNFGFAVVVGDEVQDILVFLSK